MGHEKFVYLQLQLSSWNQMKNESDEERECGSDDDYSDDDGEIDYLTETQVICSSLK